MRYAVLSILQLLTSAGLAAFGLAQAASHVPMQACGIVNSPTRQSTTTVRQTLLLYKPLICRSAPLEELSLSVPPGKEVECLMDAIKAQLKATNNMPSEAEKAARRQAMMQHVPQGTEVPQELLDMAGVGILCEAVRCGPCCMLPVNSGAITMHEPHHPDMLLPVVHCIGDSTHALKCRRHAASGERAVVGQF